nr:hypothetical protein [bacterium]
MSRHADSATSLTGRLPGILAWILCLAAVCMAIWIPDYLPFTDYPVHLALIRAAGIPGRAQPLTVDYYDTDWFTPYTIPYQLGRWMTAVIPLEITGKLLLTLYLLLTPLAMARLLSQLGKPRILALGMIPLLFNFNLSWGFLPFLLVIPMTLETAGRAIHFLVHPDTRRWLLLALMFSLVFFTHLFGLITAMVGMIFGIPSGRL